MDKKGWILVILTVAWALLILILTLTPGKYVPSYSLFSYDKLGHAGIFFIQALLLMLLFDHIKEWGFWRSVITGMLISMTYGFIIEGIQGMIPDRSMDIFDAIANIAGSFLAPVAFYVLNKTKGINSF